jgi:hypothetical protein
MEQRSLTGGTKLYFGAPASPMPAERSSAIAAAVAQVPGIVEAHLPQCFIEGDDSARQLLAIVVAADANIPQIAGALGARLSAVLPPAEFIDMLPFREGAVTFGVREAKCQIYPAESKPWWKVW